MSKLLPVLFSFLSVILILDNVHAMFRARMVINEMLETVPRTVRALSTLRGSRPIKPIEHAPFERVDRIFAAPVRFLDPSGEVFKRPTAGVLEAYFPEETKVDKHTIRIDLKKKNKKDPSQ